MSQRKNRKVHDEISDENGNKYRILKEVGRGAYGCVYSALNVNQGSTVAIKQIPLTRLSEEMTAEMMAEVKLLEALENKHIVSYLDSIWSKKYLNIIMEFVDNGSLCEMSRKFPDNQMPEKLVAIYIKQVLQGLVFLHGQGVIHRDLKGANLLLNAKGEVKLADFGVAAAAKKLQGQQVSNVVGTPYWMAPEVIEMREQTTACDIWSVGCTTLELLTGFPPYYKMNPMTAMWHIVQDKHPPIDILASELCKEFLLYCFHKNTQQRPTAHWLLNNHNWIKRHNDEQKDDEVKDLDDDGFFEGDGEDEEDMYSSSEYKDLGHYKEQNEDDIPLIDDEESIDLKEFNYPQTDDQDWESDSSDRWGLIEKEIDHKVDPKTKLCQETRDLLKNLQLDNNPEACNNLEEENIKRIQETVKELKYKFLQESTLVCIEIINTGIIPLLEILDHDDKQIVMPILDLIYSICCEKTHDELKKDDDDLSRNDFEYESDESQYSEQFNQSKHVQNMNKWRKKVLLNLCQFGFIPKIAKFAMNNDKDIQDKSMEFVKQFCDPRSLNRQVRSMFLASNGIKVLVELLDPRRNLTLEKDGEPVFSTIFSTIDCMIMVLEDGKHPKSDFCRLFTKSGLLRNLVIILRKLIPKEPTRNDDTENMKYAEKCAYIFQAFAQQSSNDDKVVQKQLLKNDVITAILTILQQQGGADKIEPNMEKTLLNLLKSIKFIAMKDKTKLIDEEAIRFIAPYLKLKFPQSLQYQCILSLFYMLKIDTKARMQAAKIGTVIPRLQSRLRGNVGQVDPCMVLAVEALQRFPLEAAPETLQELKKHGGVDFYLWMIEESNKQALLQNPVSVKGTWQEAALSALANWINSAKPKEGSSQKTMKHRLELVICQPNNVTTLILAFKRPFKMAYFTKILESLQQLCKNSERLATILASSELFLSCLSEKLRNTMEKTDEKNMFRLKNLLTFAALLFNRDVRREIRLDREQIYRILSGILLEIQKQHQWQVISHQAEKLLQQIKP